MNIFGKNKKVKKINIILAKVWFFEKFNKPNIDTSNKISVDLLMSELIPEIIEKHYQRYDFTELMSWIDIVPENEKNRVCYDVLFTNDNIIDSHELQYVVGAGFAERLKNSLISTLKYNKKEIKKDFEEIYYDYSSSKSSLVISVLVSNINETDKDIIFTLLRQTGLICVKIF